MLTDKVLCSRLQGAGTPSLVLTDLAKISRGLKVNAKWMHDVSDRDVSSKTVTLKL